MAEAKNVPRIRFPGFSGEWEQRKLGDCFSERVENMPDGELLSVTINDGIRKFSELDRHDNSNEDKSKYKKVCVGDIAYNSMRMWQGASGYSPYEGIVSPAYTVLSPKEGIVSRCIAYQFKLPQMMHIFQTYSQGLTSDNWNLKYPILSGISISVSNSTEEQTKIADFFADLDALIASHRRELEDVRKLKRAMLQKMFPREGEVYPEVRFPGFTDAWETRKLGDVGTTFNGLSGKCADDFGHGDANFITYMNVFTNPITNPDMIEHVEIDSKQKEVQVGDVFFTTSSETPEEVGMSSVIKEKQGITYLNSFCFGFRPNVQFDLDYLAYMLRSETIRSQIKLLAQGISRFNISKNKMMDITIREPSFEEQNKIGDFFSTLDSLIALREREIEHLGELKKGLLQQMFCGI